MSHPSIFIFTGTSGSGRKTIARKVGDELSWTAVRSCTTRAPRNPAQSDGDYHYVSREQFDHWDNDGLFAQTADIDGNRYGVLRRELEDALARGQSVYLVLNRAGADAIMKHYGDRAVRIFIYVDKTTMRERLESKGTSYEVVEHYLDHYSEEVTYRSKCEHVFENVNVARTAELIRAALAR
ncbi:guanylate kinase [Cohnella yongneupensis]|uniref:Guanylate kinase n=1 Tax=Cohnella yongneupensis TaxID=425006 RepID=A0ABW0QZN4_9BACL